MATRKLTKKQRQKRMAKAVAFMKDYVGSYDQQAGYQDSSDAIFIDDMLYGLGVALDPVTHKWSSGYRRFLHVLKDHLDRHPLLEEGFDKSP